MSCYIIIIINIIISIIITITIVITTTSIIIIIIIIITTITNLIVIIIISPPRPGSRAPSSRGAACGASSRGSSPWGGANVLFRFLFTGKIRILG